RRRPGCPPEMHVDRLVLVLVLRAIVHATEEHEPGVLRLAKPHLAECFSAREGAAGVCVLRDTPRVRELARREGVVAVRFGVATAAERREADGEALWRPSDGNWWIINSATNTVRVQQWGAAGDVHLPVIPGGQFGISGVYDLTFTASPSCTNLPNDLKTRK